MAEAAVAGTSRPRRKPAQSAERAPEHAPARQAERAPAHQPTHARERTRTRTSQGIQPALQQSHDGYLNLQNIPPDVSIEWKLFTAEGKEYPAYLQGMRKQGWEPVNPHEHPDWVNVPPGYDKPTVIVDGLILMERPKRLTDEAREDDRIASQNRVREAEQRLGKTPKDTMTREHPDLKIGVTKEVGRMIPIEE
jgi:hypothetical protein